MIWLQLAVLALTWVSVGFAWAFLVTARRNARDARQLLDKAQQLLEPKELATAQPRSLPGER